MRAIVAPGPLPTEDKNSLQDVTLPEPRAEGHDLLVRVAAVSVNPVDIKVRSRLDPAGPPKVLYIAGPL